MTVAVSNKFHRIFAHNGSVVADVPWQDDDNQGLPDWFFKGEFIEFTIILDLDLVEWVPAMGPAPCWEAKFSSFGDNATMFAAWDTWAKVMY